MPLITVGSIDQDFTTVAAAYASAASSGDTIEIQEDIVEAAGNMSGKSITIRSDATRRTWTGDSGSAARFLDFNSTGLTVVIERLIFKRNDGDNNDLVAFGAITPSDSLGNVTFSQCDFICQAGNAGSLTNTSTQSLNSGAITWNRCLFDGQNIAGCSGSDGSPGTIAGGDLGAPKLWKNCIFRDFGANGIRSTGFGNNEVKGDIFNCTFNNCGTGILSTDKLDVKNNVFTNNTDDINPTSNATNADYITNGFEEQTDTGGFGAGNIFGITDAIYTNAAGDDFTLVEGAAVIGLGTDLSSDGVIVDFIGTSRSAPYDISAYEYIVIPTPDPAEEEGTPSLTSPSKIISGAKSGLSGTISSSRVDEYVEQTSSLSSGGSVEDVANIDDNTKSSIGTKSGGVTITEGGNSIDIDSNISPDSTIPNAGNRFSR